MPIPRSPAGCCRLRCPQRVGGWAVIGICLIRLGQVRPRWAPGMFGLRSENAAHRIADLDEASAFFRQGSSGYSAGRGGGRLDGMELDTDAWRVEPVEVRAVRPAFFDDGDRFPRGSATLDCALLMRNVPVTWNPLRPMLVPRAPGGASGALRSA